MLNKRAQVILSASFLTILIMLTIAFVAYTTAIFNVNQYFDDYVVIGLNYRAAGEALSRDLLVNFTAYCYSKGYSPTPDLTCGGLEGGNYTVWSSLFNETFPNSFSSSAKGKLLAFDITPLASSSTFNTTLTNGLNVTWPGYFPHSIPSRPYLAYSVSAYGFYMDAPSEEFTGLKFQAAAFLAINITSVTVESEKLSVTFYSWSSEGVSTSLTLLRFLTSNSGNWTDVSGSTKLLNFANGTFTAEYNDPSVASVTDTSFFLANPARIVVGANSTV